MSSRKRMYANIMLIITAAIWGFSFVAQRAAMKYIGPFTYNGMKFALGAMSLVPLIYYYEKKGFKRVEKRI